jgi:acyl carrier protein
MAVEEEFGISIPAEQVMDMVSFKIAALMVEELAA